MKAAENTNVVPFTRARSGAKREIRILEPLDITPELIVIQAILASLTPKQRRDIGRKLRADHIENSHDETLMRVAWHIGGDLI